MDWGKISEWGEMARLKISEAADKAQLKIEEAKYRLEPPMEVSIKSGKIIWDALCSF